MDASGFGVDRMNAPLGFVLAGTPVVRDLVRYTLPRGLVARSVRSVYGHPEKVTPELVDLYFDMTQRAGNRQALSRRIDQLNTGDDAVEVVECHADSLGRSGPADFTGPWPALRQGDYRLETGGLRRSGSCAARRRSGAHRGSREAVSGELSCLGPWSSPPGRAACAQRTAFREGMQGKSSGSSEVFDPLPSVEWSLCAINKVAFNHSSKLSSQGLVGDAPPVTAGGCISSQAWKPPATDSAWGNLVSEAAMRRSGCAGRC